MNDIYSFCTTPEFILQKILNAHTHITYVPIHLVNRLLLIISKWYPNKPINTINLRKFIKLTVYYK